jgi:hypothetical protein
MFLLILASKPVSIGPAEAADHPSTNVTDPHIWRSSLVYRTSRHQQKCTTLNSRDSVVDLGWQSMPASFAQQIIMRRETDVARTLPTCWKKIVLYLYVAQAAVGTAIGFAIPFLGMT